MLDVLGDIDSDLSVYHRVDDLWEMGADRFWRLVPRLPAYGGAVAQRMRNDEERTPAVQTTPTRPVPQAAAARAGVRTVGATRTELSMSPIGDMFSFGVTGG